MVRVTFIAKGRCLSVVSETRKVPFRARHSINRSPPKRKPVIGILAIAALASSAAINVAVAQQGPATERVEPTPLAGGVALSRRRSRCNNTIASRDRTRRTYAASRRWPRYAAVANRDSPSRATVTLRERRYNGNAYRYGDRGGRYYDGRSYGGGFANFGGPFGYYNDDYAYYPYGSYDYTPYSQDCYQVRRIHTHNGWRTRRVNVCD